MAISDAQQTELRTLYHGGTPEVVTRAPDPGDNIGALGMVSVFNRGGGALAPNTWYGNPDLPGGTTAAKMTNFRNAINALWNGQACEVCAGRGHIHT